MVSVKSEFIAPLRADQPYREPRRSVSRDRIKVSIRTSRQRGGDGPSSTYRAICRPWICRRIPPATPLETRRFRRLDGSFSNRRDPARSSPFRLRHPSPPTRCTHAPRTCRHYTVIPRGLARFSEPIDGMLQRHHICDIRSPQGVSAYTRNPAPVVASRAEMRAM